MPIPFEMVMEQAPVSSQTRRRQRFHEWRQDLERAARLVWDTETPVAVPVSVTITYFFDDTPVDVDNFPKPILDALKGLVFQDDSQVYDLLCRKRNRADNLRIEGPSQGLLDALNNSRQVLHIKVTTTQNQEIAFC